MKKDYNFIWAKFLKTQEREFAKEIGYGRKEIERIGVKKFIDRMGWETESDVDKWRTDALALVVCPHCKNDFAALDIYGGGLCKECWKQYDMPAWRKVASFASLKGHDKAVQLLGFFFGQAFYRNLSSTNKKNQQDARDNFKKNLTEYMYKKYRALAETRKEGLSEYMDNNEEKIKAYLNLQIEEIIKVTDVKKEQKGVTQQ